ncbi:outer membrane protein assembly factor BamC [Aestuariibacter salexigens]|uniref:outer membrane protein assembly factor BamC n=1 Tax=Aestuariibacter salexigens TaxID=226010 RepID=UPI0003FB7341|nr:outer membrane protein assembly factor BamC [Aestuariibacter salexigens]
MKQYGLVACATVVMVLSGCASQQDRVAASGDFDYLNEQEQSRFQVPEELDTPQFSNAYRLPEVGDNAPSDLLGNKLPVRSPALILPIVSGSHVQEGSKQAVVNFDQVDDSQSLDSTIWNALINYLDDLGVGVHSFDKDEQLLVTDWIIEQDDIDSKWYELNSSVREIGKRFEFKLDMKPHGRSASLHANLIDYLETIDNNIVNDIQGVQSRTEEVGILNKIIGHYEYQIRVADAKRIRMIRQGLDMELGFDADGHPAFVVDADYDIAWPRFLLVLRKLGFDVKDLDKSNGLLFVQYGGDDEGWWSSLWSDKSGLALDKDDYRMQVSELGEKTAITLRDNENEPFDVKRVTALFDSFAQVMAQDDLDI